MDTVKFIKESKRLCKAQESCDKCAVKIGGCCITDIFAEENLAEKTVAIVEQWSKDHPVKTRQSEFLKMFPNAHKSGRVLDICPQNLNVEYMPPKRCENISCSACKTDYWNEEVSDND